jgi:hypothetical protein
MQMLYNSDTFTVVQFDVPGKEGVDRPARGGYEIVDKVARREIFLDGVLAEAFKQGVQDLIETGPTVEVLDEYIGRFASLSPQPLTLH